MIESEAYYQIQVPTWDNLAVNWIAYCPQNLENTQANKLIMGTKVQTNDPVSLKKS